MIVIASCYLSLQLSGFNDKFTSASSMVFVNYNVLISTLVYASLEMLYGGSMLAYVRMLDEAPSAQLE